jgi:probable HAF family extracellular repeat protein
MGIFLSLSKMFRRSRVKRQPATRRLVLEALEDRLCPSSTVLDLGTLGGTYSNASAVNSSGQVVGMAYTAAGAGYSHAFLWQNGAMTDLGTLGGAFSSAGDINDAGQIVGSSRTTADPTASHAFLWTPTIANGTSGSMIDLGTLGGASSSASAINNHGQIVGFSKNAGGDFHTFVWENGVMYDLDALLPASSGWVTQFYGIDINDNKQIAGTGLFNGVQRAFLITDNDGTFANGGLTITNLGTLGGVSSQGFGINSSGQVVGWSNVANGNPHAFRYSGGVMTDLKTLVGTPYLGVSYANAINDSGQIVGSSVYDSTGSHHAVIWQNGKTNDLNKQLPRHSGWVLEGAYDINGVGQIVGQGMIGGQRHAFLMVPSGSALQAVAVSNAAGAQVLSPNQVQPAFAEDLLRGHTASVDSSDLGKIQTQISYLTGSTLGLALGNTMLLNQNAAGWGWFVDATPANESEFTMNGDQGEQRHMDLLTVLSDEIGTSSASTTIRRA